jgi:hypothetical protein
MPCGIYCTISFATTDLAVPLHAMEALGGRGGIAPTHSRPRHYMGVSGQRHAPAALYPRGTDPGTHCTGGWVGPRAGLDTEVRGKILCPRRWSNPDRPVVQPVVRHYTAWATPATTDLPVQYYLRQTNMEFTKPGRMPYHSDTFSGLEGLQ